MDCAGLARATVIRTRRGELRATRGQPVLTRTLIHREPPGEVTAAPAARVTPSESIDQWYVRRRCVRLTMTKAKRVDAVRGNSPRVACAIRLGFSK
jgi:hypothetical protein